MARAVFQRVLSVSRESVPCGVDRTVDHKSDHLPITTVLDLGVAQAITESTKEVESV